VVADGIEEIAIFTFDPTSSTTVDGQGRTQTGCSNRWLPCVRKFLAASKTDDDDGDHTAAAAAVTAEGWSVLRSVAKQKKNDTCHNTTFLSLENICIHSDHSGHCGTKGQDALNVVLDTAAECRALCCERPELCAAFLYYESYNGNYI
jgi:hypothetical protein